MQGPYITNTYGGGIQCQGPTLNLTPFVTGSNSWQDPYEPYYKDPVYDMRDLTGQTVEVGTDENGNPLFEIQGDGAPDNPGDILYHIPVRTGQKANNNLSAGLSATLSIPLDGGLQSRCKQAVETQIALQQQLVANKRLDFEIARLKNCGELKKEGIFFHKKSPYYKICADIIVTNPGGVIPPHRHSIPPLPSIKNKAEELGGIVE